MDPWAQAAYNATAQHYSRLRASGNQMNVAPGLNVGQSGHQLNVNDHFGLGVSAVTANAATNQAMTGPYGSSAAHPHPWLAFPSQGLNAASHMTPTHDSSSFNANLFLHHTSYDSSVLSTPFQSKASYLPSAAVGTGFFNHMKKSDNDMNNLRNTYCSTMSGMSATNINQMTADTNQALSTGSLFPPHLQSWSRHHPNLMATNTTSGPFGVLPHEAANAVMNSGSNSLGSGHHSSHSSHSSSHSSHNSSVHSSSTHNKSSNESAKGHHFHSHHKPSSAMSSYENSFRNMSSLPPTQSSHAITTRGQLLDSNVSSKFSGHNHHNHSHNQTESYTSNMFASIAAAQVMGSDYSSMQTQRYASGLATGNQQAMTAFPSNSSVRSAYPSVGFHSDVRSREILNNSLLQSGSKQSSVTNSCNSRNINAINAMNTMNGTYPLSNCMVPMMNTSAQPSANYSSSPAHSVNTVISNNMSGNQSVSRSSSSASNHAGGHPQQGNDSSCSFGYNSPATNLPQSPYPQPQRSNSSQGTPTTASGAAVPSSTQDFSSYGTPQGFPSMGAQTPTPTPGYPTPPSSVGQPHVMSSNSQTSTTHEEQQVAHYSQLTPQTPTQSTPFAPNYGTNFNSNQKIATNGSQTSDAILTNSSSCMVAAAAMNSAQNNSTVVSQRPSTYMMSTTAIHDSEQESCSLSSMVGVNTINDSLSNNKLNSEPTLNSVFTSSEIDFPGIINFSESDATNGYSSNLKIDSNFNNKKKSKSSKKNKKKDKNKNSVNNVNNVNNVGLSVDANNAYTSYDYQQPVAPQQQYQSSYENSNPYLMPQPMTHHNQTPQESQSNHGVITNDSGGADTHSNTNSCYEMQYQTHLPQTQPQTSHTTHSTQSEHDLMQQLPHESLPSVQTQDQQMIEAPVISMASQQLTQTTTNSVSEKQTFPTIDDEFSFLTEPTDCVSMETQTPNMPSNVQMETQSPLVINQSSNMCSERSNANLSPNANQNMNSSQGNTNLKPTEYLKNFMSFINSPTNITNNNTVKEKKKKKLKESNENKVKQNNTLNGQKSNKNKKLKQESFDFNEEVFDSKKGNFYEVNQNTPKLMSGENVSNKKSTTGDRENYESKFFKRRPSTNINTNNVHIIEMDSRKDIKNNKKRKQNKINSFGSESQTTQYDEYEFPDSPPNSNSIKKSRKSSNSDNSVKKRTAPDFEKITSPSINMNIKKSNSKKNNVLSNNSKPILSTSSTESIENSINCVVMNTSLTDIFEEKTEEKPNQNNENLVQQKPNLETPKLNAINLGSITPQNNNSNNNNNNNNKKLNSNQTNKKSPNIKTSPTTVTSPTTTTTTTTVVSTVAIEHIMSPIPVTPVCPTTVNNCLTTNTPINNSVSFSAQTNSNSNNQQSVGMQSAGTNTPRRRSQDKKASTIREGLMRTGDFVVSMDESQDNLPVIWRIEGKSLLQRFEPTEQDDITVYVNTSSYSAWNPTVRQRYTGVDVRIMGCSRTRIVVEKLGLTQNNPNALNGLATIERIGNKSNSSQSTNSYHNQENFEVFIQTLISQALDPNFILEIVKENDEYFLSHVQAIDDVCSRKKSRFFSKVKWDANIVKCVETYPLFTVTAQNNVGDLRCRLCHDNWSTQIMQFSGEPYNQMTLEPQIGVDLKQTKYAACDPCADKIVLYSHLHHQKYNFFCKCKTKVENMRGGDDSKESHVILELCLQDSQWINTLFKELEEIWLSCDKIR